MRIGLEMFGTQTAGRHRGVGRYSRNLAAALLDRGSGHEFVLYAEDGPPVDLIPAAPHRLLRPAPTLRGTVARLVAENPDGLDALVLLNPLEMTPGYDIPAKPVRGGVPVLAALVYDLIPLRFPDGYLRRWPGTLFARRYARALERLRGYDALLAISEATRADVVGLLGVPPGRVVAVGTAGDDRGFAFEPAAGGGDPADLDAVRALGLGRPFVFAVAAGDPRKNLGGLIDAFARLPVGYALAVTGGLSPDEAGAARARAEARGVGAALVLTGPVGDSTLRALYRRCEAFVFPSLYEGFGLPILEALACGAAVVAGNNSSQPEAAGDAALLVNTADPDALAGAIGRVLTDKPFARSLRAKGPGQARKFSWDAVAGRTLDALERARSSYWFPHGQRDKDRGPTRDLFRLGSRPLAYRPCCPQSRPTRRATRLRIAFFSPLPPHPSGVADHAERLVDALGGFYTIDLFHDAREVPFARFRSRGFGCFDHRLFARLDRARPYHAAVYQMGNSPAHLFVYERMLERPGVVALHDLALASFHYERSARLGGGLGAFSRELGYAHPDRLGEAGRLLAGWSEAPEAMVAGLTAAGFDMNRRAVASARAVVVHGRGALERLGAEGSGKSFIVPLGAEPAARPITPDDRASARARLGLPADALIVGSFGIVHPSKLNAEALEAFADVPGAMFLVVGEEADGGLARRCAGALGLGDRVRFWGRPGADEFQALIAATDLGVALRRPPTNGESSAALLDLLRAGVASVVNDAGSFAEYPEGVVRKVRWGSDAEGIEALGEAIRGLARDPSARSRLGRAGWEHVRAHHAWPNVAARYAEVIEWSAREADRRYRGPHPVAARVRPPGREQARP